MITSGRSSFSRIGLHPDWEVRSFLLLLKPHSRWIALAAFGGLVVTLTEAMGIALVVPLLAAQNATNPMDDVPIFGVLVNALLSQPKEQQVVFIAILLIITAVLRGLAAVAHRAILEHQRACVEEDLRIRLVEQMVRLEPQYLEHQKVGNLGTMLVNHVSLSAAIADRLSNGASALLQAAFMILVMIFISWKLTLVAVVMLTIIALLLKHQVSGRLTRLAQRANVALVEIAQALVELASNIRAIHFLGAVRPMQRKALSHVQDFSSIQRSRMTMLGVISPVFASSIGVAIGLLLIVSTLLGGNTDANTATALVLILILSRLATPATVLTESMTYVTDNWQQVVHLVRFLDTTNKPYLADGQASLQGPPRTICFDGVSFSYPGSYAGVSCVHLTLEMGKCVALVGPSGAGKTTLISLLARLVDPSSGRILADNRDIRSLRLDEWRSQIAVVAQDSFTFNGTIADNLRLVRPEATDVELWLALERAGASTFVSGLPGSLDAKLGDKGMNLSGGQRQRLSIARAILSDRRIIVLDEATSQLDVESEKVVRDAMALLRGEYTVIVIAHRHSAVRDADVIHLMVDGRIEASGSHDELLGRSATYRDLFTLEAPTAG